MSLDEVLERWKQLGVYALNLFYGGDIGMDDRDTPPEERKVQLLGVPMGCVAACRILYLGKLRAFKQFDPRAERPHILGGGVPKISELKDGFYIWGSNESVIQAVEFMYPKQEEKQPRILLIVCELKSCDHAGLFNALTGEEDWAHYMGPMWFVSTSRSPDEFYQKLKPHLYDGDQLLVTELPSNYKGLLVRKTWEWLKKQVSPLQQKEKQNV